MGADRWMAYKDTSERVRERPVCAVTQCPSPSCVQLLSRSPRINRRDGLVTGTTHRRRTLSNNNTSHPGPFQSLSASQGSFSRAANAAAVPLGAPRFLPPRRECLNASARRLNPWHLSGFFVEFAALSVCLSEDGAALFRQWPADADRLYLGVLGRRRRKRSGSHRCGLLAVFHTRYFTLLRCKEVWVWQHLASLG